MAELAPLRSDLLAKATKDGAIRHGFFSRQGGVSEGMFEGLNVGLGSGDNPAHIAENRRRVAAHFELASDRLFSPWQVHSPDVAVIREASGFDGGERPKADGVVTAVPGVVLGIVTADCGPILFCDPKAGIIGAAHAGWAGAVGGVLENTIDTMVAEGAVRENIVAALGPSISQENYEVGPEFVARIVTLDSANERYFAPSVTERPEYRMFDLRGYSLDRLLAAGVQAEICGPCTYPEEAGYFSYRRTTHRGEPDYGRQIACISIAS